MNGTAKSDSMIASFDLALLFLPVRPSTARLIPWYVIRRSHYFPGNFLTWPTLSSTLLCPARYHGNVYQPPNLIRDKDNNRLFHDQVILYGPDPFDAPRDFTRFIDGVLRINEAAQLDPAFVRLDADLE